MGARRDRSLAPFPAALSDTRGRHWGRPPCAGPGERNSVEPLVARVAPDRYEQVHDFVCMSCSDPAPSQRVLPQKAQPLVGGPDAVLVIDDTALPKKRKRSVGVARPYSEAAGKLTNDQMLVSLTLDCDVHSQKRTRAGQLVTQLRTGAICLVPARSAVGPIRVKRLWACGRPHVCPGRPVCPMFGAAVTPRWAA